MATWEVETLGSVADMATDKISVSNLTSESYISTENMLPDRGGVELAAKLPSSGNVNAFLPGDVLFSNIRTYFKKVWLAQRHGGASADVIVFRPRDNGRIDSRYLYYVLSSDSFIESTVTASKGTKMPRGDKDAMRRYVLPLPPLPVQQRIAGILAAYDELIENSQRRIRILETMARALYREWFVHFRFPGHENHPRVASPLGEIPQGWEVKKLGDLITYSRRATKPGPHLEERHYVPIDCLPPKSLALLETKPIEEAQSSLQLFEKGDILFGAMRPYFHKVVVAPLPGVTRTTCFVFKPVQPEWHAFATMIAFDEATVAYANAHSQGATIPYAVWDGSLSEMPIVLPSTEVLQRFEAVVAPMLSRLAQSFFALGNLRRTRDLLLPRLLSGQIDVESLA